MGALIGADFLPTYFCGRWVWFDVQDWPGIFLEYEPYIAKALKSELLPGSIFFDIGAHFGRWSLFAANVVGSHGTVFAFEPSAAFSTLERNTLRNSRISLRRAALGDRDAQATFFGQGSTTTGSFVESVTEMNVRFNPGVPVTTYDVQMRTLDNITRELELEPRVIKVDVEGYELRVLQGARETISRSYPTWIIEIHPPQLRLSGGGDDQVIQFLESYGYSLKVLDRNANSLYTVLATHGRCGPASA